MMTIIGREMSKSEKARWRNRISKVKKVVGQEKDMQAIIEGLLYIAGEDGLKIEQIMMAIDSNYDEVLGLLKVIRKKYSQMTSGIVLVTFASRYKFVTKDFIYPYAVKLLDTAKPQTLSQSALETLAIIAYKQPITRVEIEELRGVSSEMMLRKLLSRGLIKESGRSSAPGRPILYEVTDEFMDSFKLDDLKELPELPEYENEQEDLFD